MLLIALILIAGLILFFAIQVLYFLAIIAIAVAVFFIILAICAIHKRKHKNNRMNNFEIKKDDFEDSSTDIEQKIALDDKNYRNDVIDN